MRSIFEARVSSSFSVLPVVVAVLAILTGSSACGAPFTPGNVIVVTQEPTDFPYPSYLIEFTRTGTEVQRFLIPRPGDDRARDVVVDATGRAHVYNGTFTPFLSTLDPVVGTWEHRTLDGWSCINNGSYGGIALGPSGVLCTDQQTFGPGQLPEGLVRFPLPAGPGDRPVTTGNYIDLTMGLDGLLYALGSFGTDGSFIDVFDPVTLAFLRSITLPFGLSIRAIAVDESGAIYAASWSSILYRLSGGGVVQQSVTMQALGTAYLNLMDLDVDRGGWLLVGSRFGLTVLTPSNLQVGAAQTIVMPYTFGTMGAFVEDGPVPAMRESWGRLKIRYR